MTISYTGSFAALLARWKGSLWKTIWRDVLLYLSVYYVINMCLRFAATPEHLVEFRKLQTFFKEAVGKIPLLFLLGFYVSMIVGRWWYQFNHIAWPDRLMYSLSSFLVAEESPYAKKSLGEERLAAEASEKRRMRRTVARWLMAMAVLGCREISLKVLKRFPTEEHLVEASLLTHQELELIEHTPCKYGKWWMPTMWIISLLKKATRLGYIHNQEFKHLLKELQTYRNSFKYLDCFDWISVPLVYTQVAITAAYGYFAFYLIADQIIPGYDLDTYFPVTLTLQFVFYMGWLKVAEDLMHPFGEDDDDFDMHWIIDRNFHTAMIMSDAIHGQLPDPEETFKNKKCPLLPHTVASAKAKIYEFDGHLAQCKFSDEEMEYIYPDEQEEEYRTSPKSWQQSVQGILNRIVSPPQPNYQGTPFPRLNPTRTRSEGDPFHHEYPL